MHRLFCIAFLSLAALSGCAPGDGRFPVTGVVTMSGTPVEKGYIHFSDADGVSAAVGLIRNGQFEMRATAETVGMFPGTYGIRIESWKVEPGELLPSGGFAKGESLIDMKFTDPKTSGYTAEVKEGQKNHFEFEVTPVK